MRGREGAVSPGIIFREIGESRVPFNPTWPEFTTGRTGNVLILFARKQFLSYFYIVVGACVWRPNYISPSSLQEELGW